MVLLPAQQGTDEHVREMLPQTKLIVLIGIVEYDSCLYNPCAAQIRKVSREPGQPATTIALLVALLMCNECIRDWNVRETC